MENPFKPQLPKIAVDPVTGNVIGSAETPEEVREMIRRNSEDTREAA